ARFRLLLSLHRWSSLFSGGFALVVCVTGLPLIFATDIDVWRHAPETATYAQPATLAGMADVARARHPGAQIRYAGQADSQHWFISARDATGPWHRLMFRHPSGHLVMDHASGTGLMATLLALHARLLAGPNGQLLLAAVASVLGVALVTGLLVHAPFVPRAGPLAARGRGSARLRWLDRHNLVGMLLVTWMLVLTVTGGLLALAGPIQSHWRATAFAHLLATTDTAPARASRIDLDAVTAAARQRYPQATVDFIALPGSRYATSNGYVVYLAGGPGPLTLARHAVWVDAGTATHTQGLPLGLLMSLLMSIKPLHFGDFGGLALKCVWALLDLTMMVVIATGLWLWLQRVSPRLSSRRAALRAGH
ncbi:PepSY domain-containing protein, partial [Salinisphaera sp. Q1T1-3]|uniref:PepSY-associated TM helix domain-containing protein n=1 Tax=Salinisphaera sp. Q1T1-3 TaxID=2321229 RepID=UPI000E748CE3